MIAYITQLGSQLIDTITGLGKAAQMLLYTIFSIPGLRGLKLFSKQLYAIGVLSLPIILVAALFIGMVLGLQIYNILSRFGATEALGQAVSLALLRELGPVITGLLFAGRAGSAITAEIGLMKSTEQLSSLELMGVDPLKYVVAPRFWAGLISMPILATMFSAIGIWGGYLVGVKWLGLYDGAFWANMQSVVTFSGDIMNGFIKAAVFAFVVILIAVYQGYECYPNSEGISRATTRTVVLGSLSILGLDFLLTAIMFGDF